MEHYDTFRANAAEVPILRRWALVGLVLSLALHGALVVWFYRKELTNFGPAEIPTLTPPAFVVKQVSIDPKSLDRPEFTEQIRPGGQDQKVTKVEDILLPSDKPEVSTMQDIRIAPQIAELPKTMLTEKPQAGKSGLEELAKMDALSRGNMEKELNSLAGSLLKESPRSARQPLVRVQGGDRLGDEGLGASAGIPGMKSLDDALAQTGPLPAGDAPIGMPGGALFEYDSYDLRPEALQDLRKLGALIQRNPNATFSIEGHTDSFGSPEYNRALSERRAESVKIWLVEMMGIPEHRIQTRGFGNTKPIVPANKDKDEQAPNRRVEIVVKTNR